MSKGIFTHIRTATYRFLVFLQVEPSNHSYSDMIERKKANPQDKWIDHKLNEFYDKTGYKPYYAGFVRNIFEANGVKVVPKLIDSKGTFHVWRPRHSRQMHPYNATISNDRAIQFYLECIKTRRRNQGYLSKASKREVYAACSKFVLYLGKEITSDAISNLIKHKQDHPSDFTIEDQLVRFSNQQPITSHRHHATRILGVFRENRARLQVSIDSHFVARTKKISDGILREIFLAQDFERQTLMEYQAYAGQRIDCLGAKIRLDQIQHFNDSYSLVNIDFRQNKTRIPHFCIIPRRVGEAIIKIARTAGRNNPFPNYEYLWRDITQYAANHHGVRLTSHYLRKRFHSIAQRTAMPVNDWDYLTGDKIQEGHSAESYTLHDPTDIVQEYDRFLAPHLSLSERSDPNPAGQLADIVSLTQTIATLNQVISNQSALIERLRHQLASLSSIS